MKEMPVVTFSGCEQGDVCKLPKRPSVGQRKEGEENDHEIIGELSPFCVIFVIWRCGERNEPCLSSVCYHGAATATAQTPPCCW